MDNDVNMTSLKEDTPSNGTIDIETRKKQMLDLMQSLPQGDREHLLGIWNNIPTADISNLAPSRALSRDPLSHPQQNAEGLGVPSTSQPVVKEQRDCQIPHNEPTPSISVLQDTPVAEEQYKKSGLADTLHGFTYQLKFLVLCFLKGLLYKDFRLGAEAVEAHKFDDSFIKYKDKDGKDVHKFFQCKSKKDGGKRTRITMSDLLGKDAGPFDLLKYFTSYYQIRKSDEFSYNVKNEYIICTNTTLSVTNNLKNNGIELLPKVSVDPILKTAGENNLFTLELDKSVSQISDFIELCKFDPMVRPSMTGLFEMLKSGNTLSVIPNIPAHYHKTLAEDIWEFTTENGERSIKFKEGFLNSMSGLSEHAETIKLLLLKILKIKETQFKREYKEKSFPVSQSFFKFYDEIKQFKSYTDTDFEQLYNLIFECVQNPTSSVIQINSDDAIIQYLMEIVAEYIFVKEENVHKLNRNLLDTNVQVPAYLNPFISKLNDYGEHIYNYNFDLSNFHVFFEEYFIDEFFNKFIWMVNLTEENIDTEIETLLREKITSIKSKMTARCLLSRIIEWIKESKGTYLSMEHFDYSIDTINNEISTLGVTEVLSPDLVKKLENYKMVYNEIDPNIKCFLNNSYPDPQLFNCICSNSTLASIQVLQALQSNHEDDYVFVSSQSLCGNIEQYLKTFQKCVKFLVIILDKKFNYVEYSRLFNILPSANEKKIIFISQIKISDYPFINVGNDKILKIKKAHITVNINDFNNEIIERTLAKSFTLQRKEVCFKGMMGQDGNVNLSCKYQQKFCNRFLENENIFLDLCGEKLSLGGKLPEFCESLPYYIPRQFKIHDLQEETKHSAIADNGCSVEVTHDQPSKSGIEEIYDEGDSLEEMTTKKVVLIMDVAGMGKSTVLSNMCKSLKNQHPNNWVIRLDLNQLSKIFSEHKNKEPKMSDEKEAVLFLINEVLIPQQYLSKDLENEVLKCACLVHGNVVLILDGVDEVCPDYMDFIVKWIQSLKQSKISKILLTSRPHLREKLVESFDPFILTLEKFSRKDQLDFLIEYWKGAIKSNDESARHIEKYAITLLDGFSKTINDRELEFTGIPLLIKLLAEVMLDSPEDNTHKWLGCRQYVQQKGAAVEANIPDINLHFLYTNFINKKIQIFIKDKIGSSTSAASATETSIYEKCLKEHKLLALKTVLPEEDFKRCFDEADVDESIKSIREHIEKPGLIVTINGEIPVFIHRTIAEYLVADHVANSSCHNEEFYDFIHTNILSDSDISEQYDVTRTFLNMNLEGAEKKYGFADNSSKSVSPIALKLSDDGGFQHFDSFIQAAQEGHTNIMLALLSGIGEVELCRELLRNGFVSEDVYMIGIVLDIPNKRTLKLLIELLIPDSERNISISSQDSEPDLRLALVKWLYNAEMEEDIYEANVKLNDIIHASAMRGHNEILDWLLLPADSGGCGGDVNGKDDEGDTPLHIAVYGSRLSTVKWLLTPVEENGAGADPDIKGNNGLTALELAKYKCDQYKDNPSIQAVYIEMLDVLNP